MCRDELLALGRLAVRRIAVRWSVAADIATWLLGTITTANIASLLAQDANPPVAPVADVLATVRRLTVRRLTVRRLTVLRDGRHLDSSWECREKMDCREL